MTVWNTGIGGAVWTAWVHAWEMGILISLPFVWLTIPIWVRRQKRAWR